MKIKFTALLLLALSVSSTSVFTSCKDNDEDQYNELRAELSNQNAKLTQLIESQKKELQAQIDALNTRLNLIKSCECGDINKKITNAIEQYMLEHPAEDVKAAIKKYLEENPGLSKDDVNYLIDLALADYCKKNGCLTEKNVFDLIKQYADAGVDEAFVRQLIREATINLASQQSLEDAIKDLQEAISKGDASTKKELLEQIQDASKAAAKALAAAQLAQETADAAELAAYVAKLAADKAQSDANDANNAAGNAYNAAVIAQQAADFNAKEIEKIKSAILGLDQLFIDAAYTKALAEKNAAAIKVLESIVNSIDLTKYYTKAEINKLLASKVSVSQLAAKAEEVLSAANLYTEVQIGLVNNKIADIDATLSDLQNAYKTADAELQSEINRIKSDMSDLQGDVSDLQDNVSDLLSKVSDLEGNVSDLKKDLLSKVSDLKNKINEISEDVEALKDQVNDIDESIKKQITGITVQSTYNNVIGSFALPFGISSNILMTYYGEADTQIEFPTTGTANYVYPENALTEEDWQMLGLTYVDVFEAQGGSILMSNAKDNAGTIYVTINPSNVDFAGQTLKLVNSQDQESGIKLGALVKSNKVINFGVSRATDNGFYEAPAKLSKDDINNVKVNIIDGWKQVITDMVNQHNGTSIAAFVKQLNDQLNGILPANAVKATWSDPVVGERSVYSQYGIAATAFKPLGFGIADKFAQKVGDAANEGVNFIDRHVDGIDDLDFTLTLADMSTTVSAKDKLHSFLDKVNQKTQTLSKRTRNFFLPTLVVSGNSTGTKILSRDIKNPTKISDASVTLFPTTYSGEVLAPCFKKHVACVNVYRNDRSAKQGSAACKTALKEFNTGLLNKVVDGQVFEIPASVKEGYIYEIAYSALDYRGQIVTRRYYVTY